MHQRISGQGRRIERSLFLLSLSSLFLALPLLLPTTQAHVLNHGTFLAHAINDNICPPLVTFQIYDFDHEIAA